MIFEACDDYREAVLQQEVLLYLAPLIVSSPDMLTNVLRVRLGYVTGIVDIVVKSHEY